MTAVAIVTAAGRGERMGPGDPKALRLLDGLPLFVHAVRAMAAGRDVVRVVVVAPLDAVPEVRDALGADEVLTALGVTFDVVSGGRTRQQSVSFGVAAIGDDVDVVLVHDAARPLVPLDVVDRVVDAVMGGAPAVIPVLPISDTMRSVDSDGGLGPVVDRAGLRAVQTPQGFARSMIEQGHAAYAADSLDEASAATDDAVLVERLGVTVVAVRGSEEAFKVTRPFDLALAEIVIARRRDADGS